MMECSVTRLGLRCDSQVEWRLCLKKKLRRKCEPKTGRKNTGADRQQSFNSEDGKPLDEISLVGQLSSRSSPPHHHQRLLTDYDAKA